MLARAGFILGILAVSVNVLAVSAEDKPPATQPAIDLTHRAMTVLRNNCYSCHNPEKKKGGLSFSSRQDAIAGGDEGEAFVPGQASKSAIANALSTDADPHMPPKRQLSPEEIKVVRDWIDAGAAWDSKVMLEPQIALVPTTRPVTLQPLPDDYHPVLALALSTDQTRLAIARGDRILVYDLSKKERPIVFETSTPHEVVYSLAWTSDGKMLATGGFRKVRLWDLKAGTPVQTFGGFAGRVMALAFTPDNLTLLAGEGEPAFPGIIRSWSVKDAKSLQTWKAHGDAIFSMTMGSDGILYTASADKLIKGWKLPEGTEAAKFEGHTGPVMAVALSPDGKRLASAGADKEIKIWDRKTYEQTTSLLTNPAGITSLGWVSDKLILSAAEDGVARFSSVENKERAEKTFSIAGDVLYSAVVARDGMVYGGCHDGSVLAWSSTSDKPVEKLALNMPAAREKLAATHSAPISFANDIMPALSRAGCNAGACHAKPLGQAGFKLSVFAYDPQSDFVAIVKSAHGRRLFPAAPEESLLLKKPTLELKHGGGKRLDKDSDVYRLLVRWIGQGMPYAQPGDPVLVAVDVTPKQGRYPHGAKQLLRLIARYSDGSKRDVTTLADFASNDKEIARVSEEGVVHVGSVTGETAIVARFMGRVDVTRIIIPAEHVLAESQYSALPVNNFIDPMVYDRLKSLGILPSAECTDAEFLRRASLDVIGVLPTPAQAEDYLASHDPEKRTKLIDRLLADSRYGDCWANKWADLLRPNPFRVGVKSVYILDQWLRDSFRRNKPYDQFAREILLAQGSTHRDGPVVIYRDRREPADLTTLFSQVFLGVRLECAKCHHHPNEKWSQDDFYQLAAFFGPLKRKGQGISAPISGEAEYIWFAPGGDVKHPVTGEVMHARAPDSPAVEIKESRDPREVFAEWMTRPENPFFAKALVNRVWAELMGRGIVTPVDDMRVSNPATNEPLLEALAKDFVSHGHDIKHLIRTILLSRAYQASSLTNETNVRDTKNFSRWYRRRPSAEAMLDAVTAVTGVPELLPGLAPGSRAMQVWNNRLESDFLDAFNRPNSSADPPCERDRDGTIVQALHLMNSTRLMTRIADPTGRAAALSASPRSPERIVIDLYLSTYSRYPMADERQLALGAFKVQGATRQTATEDLLWALLNSAEFVFNH